MTITVHLAKFMSHEGTHLELPSSGVVAITGPNGAGKSAIIEAFATAIWGRGTRSSKWSPWRKDEAGGVMIDDGFLCVSRRVTAAGKKSLQWKTTDQAESFDTTSKGQEGLDAVVGSFDAWRRTSVFSASDAAHFTMATDAERKELLEELLGLGWFDRALTQCRRDLAAARSLLGQAERDRDIAAARAEESAKAVAQAQRLLAETPDAGDVGLLRAELVKVERYLREADADRRDRNAERMQLLSVGGEALAESRELRSRLQRLSGDTCFTCGQPIPQSLRDDLLAQANAKLSESARLRGDNLVSVEKLASDIGELDDEISALSTRRDRARSSIDGITRTRDLRNRLHKEAEAAAAAVLELGQKAVAAGQVIEQRRVDVAELEACERVLGVRGVRAILLGKTLASIEALANTWLVRLGSQIQVQLRPYTEKKSGGTVDSISLGLTGAGGESGYIGASAGERRRVDVAILLALAELASGTAAGRKWRSPVFFDEVFDVLDEDGRDAVAELVRAISRDRLVVLITHSDALVTMPADLRLKVDGGRVT